MEAETCEATRPLPQEEGETRPQAQWCGVIRPICLSPCISCISDLVSTRPLLCSCCRSRRCLWGSRVRRDRELELMDIDRSGECMGGSDGERERRSVVGRSVLRITPYRSRDLLRFESEIGGPCLRLHIHMQTADVRRLTTDQQQATTICYRRCCRCRCTVIYHSYLSLQVEQRDDRKRKTAPVISSSLG